MNLRMRTLSIAVLKVVVDEGTARLGVLKEQAKADFADSGASQAHALLPDGTKVASVSLSGGGKSAILLNDRDFFEWVKAVHPDETQVVVRESFRKKILDASAKAGRPVDPVTGETVPGVAMTDKVPYVSVRFTKDGKDAIVQAWRDGTLTGIDLIEPLAIESGDDDVFDASSPFGAEGDAA